MENAEIAIQLGQFADLLDIQGENAFRVNAFRRAADTIGHYDQPVADLVASDSVQSIPGIGAGIAAVITELVQTGHFVAMDELLYKIPGTLLTLLDVPGVGPKTAGRLYRELSITDLVQLQSAAERAEIRTLKGFGPRQEQRILEGIAFLNKRTGRTSIGVAWPLAHEIAARLREAAGCRVEIVGSVRRRLETVGGIDFVADADARVMAEALSRSIQKAEDIGQTEAGIVTARIDGIAILIASTTSDRFGTDQIRFTGSAAHVAELEQRHGGTIPQGETEKHVYAKIGLSWIPPELREGRDEIDLAAAGHLPNLITAEDIQGDLHLHSVWSDGHGTVRDMALAARSLGYRFLAISDHSRTLGIANGLSIERLREQRIEIEAVNVEFDDITLLCASEVEVLTDGTLDYPDEVLAELDIVVASLHSGLRQDTETHTRRILRAINNPHVDIIAHPTGRIVERRQGAEYDWDAVFHAAHETGTALEINANPARLDLTDEMARRAHEAGVTITINSDAHDIASLTLMHYGVGVARRAGIEATGVINTHSLDALRSWLRR